MGMIITRRPGESVDIGDARVTVVRLRNGRVKLRVEAPGHVRITPGRATKRCMKTVAVASGGQRTGPDETQVLRVQG